MELFNGKDVRDYTLEKHNRMSGEIECFSDQDIMAADFDGWISYFKDEYSIQQIELFEDNIEPKSEKTTISRTNDWIRRRTGQEYISLEGFKITFSIPFDGEPKLLKLRPSSRLIKDFYAEDLTEPEGDKCGMLTLSFEYGLEELKSRPDMKSFVWDNFRQELENYKKMITYVNKEIGHYNDNIALNARKLLENRKEKACDFAFVSETLDIPLVMSENAPNTVPIVLKKVRRKPIAKPEFEKPTFEYTISDADYRNIINIIHSVCAAMEETAKTFHDIEEESLRDFIIATLGTHYENRTTGETFRHEGKTDIRIVFENKAAFIGECKIWHGIKKLEEAKEQLFGYSIWRDVKVALIFFNKDNKDFGSIRDKVLKWIKENTKRYTVLNGNVWNCVIHREDTNADVEVAISLYDLSV